MARDVTLLPNSGNLCFRNAALHALFSMDKYVQLLEAGASLMDPQDRPLFSQLRDLALRFRRGESSVGTNNAIDPVWNTITTTGADPTTPVSYEFATNSYGGDRAGQEDCVEFLEYLLWRLTSTEISVDLYEYDPDGVRICRFVLT